MMASTVARALSNYGFRRFRPEDAAAGFKWVGGGVVLLCCEILPREDGIVTFRIVRALDAAKNALAVAKGSLEVNKHKELCADGQLFALLGSVPENKRKTLLAKIEDVVITGRSFSIQVMR